MVDYPGWYYPLLWGGLFVGTYLGLTGVNRLTGRKYELINQRKERLFLASRTMTMTHALSALYFTGKVMFGNDPHWTINNTTAQNHMLGMSVGYFMYDLVYLNICEFSWIYNAHHLLSISSIGSQWLSGVGGYHGACLMFLAEITNPIQIIWDIARIYRHRYPLATRLYRLITPLYVYFFFLVRGLMVPSTSVYHWWVWNNEPIAVWLTRWWSLLGILLNGAGFWWIRMMVRKFILNSDKTKSNTIENRKEKNKTENMMENKTENMMEDKDEK